MECRRYFYRGIVTKSGQSQSWSWSPDRVTVVRQFGFSLCAAPPRTFFVLIYKGSKWIRVRRHDKEGSIGYLILDGMILLTTYQINIESWNQR